MPDLATELHHLELADQHIEQAHQSIRDVSEAIARRRSQGLDPVEALTSLRTFNETLSAFHAHRALIIQTISDIREGKL